jgi:hypothetical protein
MDHLRLHSTGGLTHMLYGSANTTNEFEDQSKF